MSSIFRPFTLLRGKGPLTDYIRKVVEVLVEELESQVGHPHVIGVGKDEADGDSPPPFLDNGPFFLCEEFLLSLDDASCHRAIVPRDCGILHGEIEFDNY